MFDSYKINKYSKKLLGFAYEFSYPKYRNVNNIDLKIYLVIEISGYLKFIKYKYYNNVDALQSKYILENNKALTIQDWINNYNEKKQLLYKDNNGRSKILLFKKK